MNAVLVPNDENAAPIISYLKTLNIPAKKFPVTGQDATLVGVQNVISGYQCGTAYKPIYLEAQAAAALALYLRAGKTPPAGLVNGSVKDTTANVNGALVAAGPRVGHPDQRGVHGGRRRVRPRLAAVRRRLCGRLHHLRDPLTRWARRT